MKRIIDRLSNQEFINICESIAGTKNNIHHDLHSKVCLLFHNEGKGSELNDQDLKKLFSSYAYNEFTRNHSSFNFERKPHKRKKVKLVNVSSSMLGEIPEQENNVSDQKKEMYDKVLDYLDIKPETEEQNFINQISKMYFEGWTVYRIEKETKISKKVIEYSIKQFIKDVQNHYNIDSNSNCFSDNCFSTSE